MHMFRTLSVMLWYFVIYVYKRKTIGKQMFKILTLIQINIFFHNKVNFRCLVKFVK